MQWLKDRWMDLGSDYLHLFWWLVAGYVLAYLIAHVIARAGGPGEHTIVYRCRNAWGIVLFVHALISSAFVVNWYLQNGGQFASFWRFFPFYLTMLIVDLIFAFVSFVSRQRYANYHE